MLGTIFGVSLFPTRRFKFRLRNSKEKVKAEERDDEKRVCIPKHFFFKVLLAVCRRFSVQASEEGGKLKQQKYYYIGRLLTRHIGRERGGTASSVRGCKTSVYE